MIKVLHVSIIVLHVLIIVLHMCHHYNSTCDTIEVTCNEKLFQNRSNKQHSLENRSKCTSNIIPNSRFILHRKCKLIMRFKSKPQVLLLYCIKIDYTLRKFNDSNHQILCIQWIFSFRFFFIN